MAGLTNLVLPKLQKFNLYRFLGNYCNILGILQGYNILGIIANVGKRRIISNPNSKCECIGIRSMWDRVWKLSVYSIFGSKIAYQNLKFCFIQHPFLNSYQLLPVLLPLNKASRRYDEAFVLIVTVKFSLINGSMFSSHQVRL